MNIAFIFPGQGAQYVGMGKDFYETYPEAKKIFDEADSLLGYSLSSILFEGPENELTKTKYSQVAIYVDSCAILAVVGSRFPQLVPNVCAGLSLGEYTALYAAKKISFEDGLKLVQKRAEFMNDACEKHLGKMSAVLGLSEDQVREAVQDIEGVWIANCNCPMQVVISGTSEGVEVASTILKEKKAKRILPLTVHGAFHSGLMKDAEISLTPFVDNANIQSSDIQLVMNVVGDFVDPTEEIKTYLKRQVTHSVLWEKGILAMETKGIDLYVEMGPGKTLAGMNRKINTKEKTISIDNTRDIEDLKCLLEEMEKVC